MFSEDLIEQLSMFIIRPPRELYGIDRLGPKTLVVKSASLGTYMEVNREQATILSNSRKIQLSLFEPQSKNIYQANSIKANNAKSSFPRQREPFMSKSTQFPSNFNQISDWSNQEAKNNLIFNSQSSFSKNQQNTEMKSQFMTIFLHSNSGSRLQGLQYAKYLMKYDQKVCLFDYSASGLSEGEFITMGLRQSEDLHAIINYLKNRFKIQRFCLWGRSMGAVTAILYASKFPQNVQKLVLDSPFSNFRQLLKQIVNSRTGLPQFLYGPVMDKVQSMIIQKTGYNLMEIDLLQRIKQQKNFASIPCIFLISKDDKLVKCSHVEALHSEYSGNKKIIYLDGSHNKPRPTDVKEQCAQFLSEKILNTSGSKKKIQLRKVQFLKMIHRKASDEGKVNKKSKFSVSTYLGETNMPGLQSYSSHEIQRQRQSQKDYTVPMTPNQPIKSLKINMKKKGETELNGVYNCTSGLSTERKQEPFSSLKFLPQHHKDIINTTTATPGKVSLSQLKKNSIHLNFMKEPKINKQFIGVEASKKIGKQQKNGLQAYYSQGNNQCGQNNQKVAGSKQTIFQYKNRVRQYNSKY